MRAERRALAPAERRRRSKALCRHLLRSPLLLRARRIACFYPHDGEADLRPLFPRIWSTGKLLYLPVIAGSRLWFARYHRGAGLVTNRFGIPEPRGRGMERCALLALDLILMPLVAFDPCGNRLGMGGGYYDRTLAFRRWRRALRRPRLVGVALALQRRPRIRAQVWDVRLDAAVTEEGLEWF